MPTLTTARPNTLTALFNQQVGHVKVTDLHAFTDDWLTQLARHWEDWKVVGDGILFPGRIDRHTVIRVAPRTMLEAAATGADIVYWDIADAIGILSVDQDGDGAVMTGDRYDGDPESVAAAEHRRLTILEAARVVAGFQAALPQHATA
ncbi:hypothetical protein [Agromyces humi]|uniref:hypothetical protein n=1 Tax=Agromyces humi TaxID=1766800 RepID=UPI001357E1B1|nr:hypothetical protein [Agromyces humi]